MYNVHTACKPRIRLSLLVTGAYSLRHPPTWGAFWGYAVVTDRNIAEHNGLAPTLQYYRNRRLNALHNALVKSVFYIPAA